MGTLLVVDDEDQIRSVLREYFEGLGHTVLEAGTGLQALTILRSGVVVDVMLLDLRMPIMTGQELVEAMQIEGVLLPVVLMTGFADSEEYDPHQVQGLLKKPFSLEKITEVVQPWLEDPASPLGD